MSVIEKYIYISKSFIQQQKHYLLILKNLKLFPSNISSMEKKYQGKWNCAVLADYCWTLARDAPTVEYKRQARRKKLYDFVC
jgi:hypothetical protein